MVNAKSYSKFIVNNDVDVVKIVVDREENKDYQKPNIIIYEHIRNTIKMKKVKKLICTKPYNTYYQTTTD